MPVGDGDSRSGVYWAAAKDTKGHAPSSEAERMAQKLHAQARKRAENFGYIDVFVPPVTYTCSTGEVIVVEYFGHEGICHPRTTIFPPGEREVIERCPVLKSGLADVQKPWHVGSAGLNRFYPREHVAEPEGWVATSFPDTAVQFADRLPGRYSGLMRAVVQDMLGRSVVVGYDYRYHRTHGIYVSTLTGEHHVIEVKSDGIRTWPITKCEPNEGEDYEVSPKLGYIPAEVFDLGIINEDIVYTDVTQSGGESWSALYGGPVGQYYGSPDKRKYPFWEECGWAFSYTGHECSTVISHDIYSTERELGGLQFTKSYLYTITFTEDPETGAPSTFSVQEVETGWLYGNRNNIFKFPNYTKGTLGYFDWFRGNGTGPTLDTRTAPLHCWYEKDDTLQVVRHRDGGDGTVTSYPPLTAIDQNYPLEASFGTFGTYTESYANPDTFQSPVFDTFVSNVLIRNGTKQTRARLDSNGSTEFGESNIAYTGAYASVVYTQAFSDSFNNDEVVVAPFNEREAIAHYRNSSSSQSQTAQTAAANFAETFIGEAEGYAIHFNGWTSNTPYSGYNYPIRKVNNRAVAYPAVHEFNCPLDRDGLPDDMLYFNATTTWDTSGMDMGSVFAGGSTTRPGTVGAEYGWATGVYYYAGYPDPNCYSQEAGPVTGNDQATVLSISQTELEKVCKCKNSSGYIVWGSNYVSWTNCSDCCPYPKFVGPEIWRFNGWWYNCIYGDPDGRYGYIQYGRNTIGWSRTQGLPSVSGNSPADSTSSSTAAAGLWADGRNITLPLGEQADWQDHTMEEANATQYFFSLDDSSSDNLGVIYTSLLTYNVSEMTASIGWDGPSLAYPYDEISYVYPAWVGNPRKPS